MKKKIIAIIGNSGSGKTTIANYITKKYKIPTIQSYTTRPKRYKDETGHTFITNEQFKTYKKEDFIAYTKFGEHHYFCLQEQLKETNLYIVDDNGFIMLRNNPDIQVVGLRIIRQYKTNISLSRQSRDKDMFTIPLIEYDYIIDNNGSKEVLYSQVDEILKEILKQ